MYYARPPSPGAQIRQWTHCQARVWWSVGALQYEIMWWPLPSLSDQLRAGTLSAIGGAAPPWGHGQSQMAWQLTWAAGPATRRSRAAVLEVRKGQPTKSCPEYGIGPCTGHSHTLSGRTDGSASAAHYPPESDRINGGPVSTASVTPFDRDGQQPLRLACNRTCHIVVAIVTCVGPYNPRSSPVHPHYYYTPSCTLSSSGTSLAV
jgi:hypothetical protein